VVSYLQVFTSLIVFVASPPHHFCTIAFWNSSAALSLLTQLVLLMIKIKSRPKKQKQTNNTLEKTFICSNATTLGAAQEGVSQLALKVR
jgi:hypothetical protein